MASQYLKSSIKPLTYVGGFVLLSALGGCASLTGQPLASGADAGTVNARAQAPNPGRLSIADLVNLPLDSAAQSDLKKAAPKAGGLWGVIASDYGMPMETDHQRVQKAIALYTQYPGYLTKVSARAKPYLDYIVDQLKQRHMPLALALLPIVESAYDPYAYSSSAAGGLWQFTPGTARHFGVRINWWYDGRRSLYASTNAALDYLDQLYRKFGSWYLALAAYNSGAGTVQWAINYNKARGLPTDYWSLPLPAQTQFYVPKLIALMAIFSDPARYHIKLVDIPDKTTLEIVPLHHQIDLQLAARLAGVSLATLRELNPGYSRWATPPDGVYHLALPRAKAAVFLKRLQSTPTTERVTWVRRVVQPGDTLSGFAARYGTTVAVLRRINGLHGNLIRVGQSLLLPQGTVSYASTPAVAKTAPYRYRVRSGDSLWSIAHRYGLTVADLRRWNDLSAGHMLSVGEVLRLRPAQAPAPAHAVTATATAPASGGSSGQWRNITVASGDTLWSLAQKYHTSYAALAKWNGLNPQQTLAPGMRLAVYVQPLSAPSNAGAATSRPAPAPASFSKVQVAPGDSLWSIARRYGVTVQQLASWNGLNVNSTLRPGMILKVKAAESSSNTTTSTAAVAKQNQAAGAGQAATTVTVQAGDSLWSIAARYGTTPAQLASWNNLPTNAILRPGMKLIVHEAAQSRPNPTPAQPPLQATRTVTVQPGDSLWSIAASHNIPVSELVQINGLKPTTILHPGMQLRI